ncbi:MAG: hypothetical protein J5I93_28875 [Pirellulaceae bacterium]|nr:hypothetical protein [Pirellulaceae bacterium]
MRHLTHLQPWRRKPGHSETGLAVWHGKLAFYKRYEDPAHYAVETQALDLLRSHAPVAFRFVDYIAASFRSSTIAFPRYPRDASRAASESRSPEQVVAAVCDQIVEEIAAVGNLPLDRLPLRAAEPWHFLHRMAPHLDEGLRPLLELLPHSPRQQIVFRYDPQLDNFLVSDCQTRLEIWSIDFSMWRRMHLAYPFAFLWHDLLERPRPNLDPRALGAVILNRFENWLKSCDGGGQDARAWLLACRAEALAHELDGYTRRGHTTIAQQKNNRLNQTLREFAQCHS